MRIIKYLVCLCCLGCNSPEKHTSKNTTLVPPIKQDSLQQASVKPVAKSIDDLPIYTWGPHHPDTTSYLCEMKFEDEYAMVFFHAQCIYFFFTSTTHAKDYQQVQLIWTYKSDCLLNMSFLERSNDVKQYPRYGNRFATYKLINDTTLWVEYMFPEWVQKVNQIARDSLFPQRLYLKRD